ncbi:MAG: hypothetical protein KDE03_08655 [Rhodobacteraceae bacterium]|nr:hypothetical protein [Paracoccaceae bacterium]
MKAIRRALTSVGVFSVAAAAGFLMQNDDRIGSLRKVEAGIPLGVHAIGTQVLSSADPAPVDPPATGTADPLQISLPDLPNATIVDLRADRQFATRVSSAMQAMDRETAADMEYTGFGVSCHTSDLQVTVRPDAALRVSMASSCHPSEDVQITHAGLTISATTDANGALDIFLPAFTGSGLVSLAFADGDSLTASSDMPVDLKDLVRIAVNWDGFDGFRLGMAQAPADATGTAMAPVGKTGATIAMLGGPVGATPHLAEVYTIPQSGLPHSIRIEAEVTEGSCGRDLSGLLLIARAGEDVVREPLVVTMPGCDALGDRVVLDYPLDPVPPMSVALNNL